jgi:dipeptidyl aminopeptidase/acylaminoacyl peptidase
VTRPEFLRPTASDPDAHTESDSHTGPDSHVAAADLSAAPEEATEEPGAGGSPWADLNAYVATPRLGGLVLGPDGHLLVSVSALDPTKTAYRSAWWRVDTTGERPARRYTRSVEGESAAAFLPDGSLLFTSKRPVPPTGDDDSDDVGATWCLPAGGGEAYVLARRDGGWQNIITARDTGSALFAAGVHAGAADEAADAAKRKLRSKRKISAILHEGYPVRFWDHDLGLEETHLLAVELGADSEGDRNVRPGDFHDLIPDAGRRIGSSVSLAADGRFAVLDWLDPRPGGETVSSVAAVEIATGHREVLSGADDEVEFGSAVISDDSSLVACVRERRSTPQVAPDQKLWLVERETGAGRPLAPEWDAWPNPIGFSPDRRTLYVVVDEDGHGPLYAVDVATGDRRRLTQQGTHSSVRLSADGEVLYAVRSSYTDPGSIVAVSTRDATSTVLPAPVSYPELPGRLENVETVAADGARVRGYLLLPEGASEAEPVPLLLWIHGGPLGSWNAWSWRWCPWLMVAQGYAVLLPDPALSTGYGLDFIQRGWGSWGGAPYTDLMAITDQVAQRSDIDHSRTAAMGGSFGGYMANWVAGHTDRFSAIVSHASLWNLESFGPTTDASWYWARELSAQMQAEHSPHRHAENITTPMLVIHGDKDYRVPISEGLALWWSLVSGYQGPPEKLPHKFLYFPDENHWILTPQHSVVWYQTVLAFLQAHLGDGNFARPETL